MWLLDANVDVHLAAIFRERGIECDTVAHRGWKTLSNGELVAAAFAEGFRCLLTRDQLFGESASRALKSFPDFAVVVCASHRLLETRFLFMLCRRPGRYYAGERS